MDVLSSTDAAQEITDHEVMDSTALLGDGISDEFDGNTVKAAEVTFRPGERTKFHTHGGVQILYVTEGKGIVATREDEREVSEGDLVLFPAGEEHWHGTTEEAESSFSHVYFIAEPTESGLTILDAP